MSSCQSSLVEPENLQLISSLPKPSKLVILSHQLIGLVSLVSVIGLWLIASILTRDILKDYNKPALMTFLSVVSMQIYFVFLKIKDPLHAYLDLEPLLIIAFILLK